MGQLSVRAESLSGATIVRVTGDLVAGSLDELRNRLREVIETGDGPLLVDLAGVRDWSHRVVGPLVSATARATARGRHLGVLGLADRALEDVRRSGLTLALHAYDSVAA